MLAHPNFDVDFALETDASVKGLGAVLFQHQSDDVLHPVAFASQSLSPAERNYGVTDLKTHAVAGPCSITKLITDHSAVSRSP